MTKTQKKPSLPHERLRQLRLDRDWSYEVLTADIVRVTGVRRTVASWSRICQGKVAPSERTMGAMLRYLEAEARAHEVSSR